MACTTAQEISCVHLIPHGGGACVCLSQSMEARLIALEDRLRQTEEVLVAERLARQTAEAAQQTVGPQPAGAGAGGERPPGLPSLVDTEAIGKPPTFSGDVDVTGQPEGMHWSQWSFFCIPELPLSVRPDSNQVAEAGGNKRGRSCGR